MNSLEKKIIIYSAAEQLAKNADFKGSGIDPYLQRAELYYGGDVSAFDNEEKRTMRLQELHLLDQETQVLKEFPELAPEYAKSDKYQLKGANDSRNLDYYLETGVDYNFDIERLLQLQPGLDMERPISAQLMRERLVGVKGLGTVRINVIYHDALDHLWALSKLREASIDERYADYTSDIGNPFTGFLFSKQAELVGGIGYNTRRYQSDPGRYKRYGASVHDISNHLAVDAEADFRVAEAIQRINDSKDLAQAAGFVINGAISSILLQRSRSGATKRVIRGNKGYELTGEPVKLLDSRYISLMIDGIEALLLRSDSYQEMQLELNLTVEALLRECLEKKVDLGRIAIGTKRDFSSIPPAVQDELLCNSGVSTSYYS